MKVLSTNQLHKRYKRITAVNQLNLDIEAGTVFGLPGPNGSGKTTTLGMILGVTAPTSGDFLWFGERPSHHQRRRVGAILEKPNFYPNNTAEVNLQLAAKIKETGRDRIDEVLEQVGLLERKRDPFKTYSLGMKQRLAIGSALLANPEVLILDEPTNGLDPKGIAEIRQLITDIAQSGKTIILASHLLDEVQKVCTDFAILNNGKLIHTGKVDDDFSNETVIELAAHDMEQLIRVVQQWPAYGSHKILRDRVELTCETGTLASDLNRFLSDQGIYANHLMLVKKNLEQQFMDIVSQNENQS